MYQTLHETIQVIALFSQGNCTPKKYLWRGTTFFIDQITLKSDVKDGGVKWRYFSVVANDSNVYRLSWNLDSLEWFVEEVWID